MLVNITKKSAGCTRSGGGKMKNINSTHDTGDENSIADRIMKLRGNITRKELCRIFNLTGYPISEQNLSKYETRKRSIPHDVLVAYHNQFNVSMDYLYFGTINTAESELRNALTELAQRFPVMP